MVHWLREKTCNLEIVSSNPDPVTKCIKASYYNDEKERTKGSQIRAQTKQKYKKLRIKNQFF